MSSFVPEKQTRKVQRRMDSFLTSLLFFDIILLNTIILWTILSNTVHGGVCTVIKDNINFTALDDLQDESFEALWIKLQPERLPRGYNCIVLGTIYHPSRANNSAILEYLWKCLSTTESRFSNCLLNSLGLKQIVNFPTRGKGFLDWIFTNLAEFYKDPIQRPSHGLSDHMSVELQPRNRSSLSNSKITIKSRDLRPSNRLSMRTYLCREVDAHTLVSNADSCEEKTSIFESIIQTGLNAHTLVSNSDSCEEKMSIFESIIQTGLNSVLPLQSKTVHSGEPPWLNPALKKLIMQRQRALAEGNRPTFRYLRNRVNRECKTCRTQYYESKVNHLKDCRPSVWWKEIKRLSGLSSAVKDRGELKRSLQLVDGYSSAPDLAKLVNDAFLSPMQDFTPLSEDFYPAEEAPASTAFVVSSDAVYLKLAALNSRKASGPDGVPTWLLKENADLLAPTITDIINSSFAECRLPPSWKSADIVPIPKQKPIKDVNKHLRPISLTPVLSKVAEEFVVEEHLKLAILKKIGDNQYGAIPNSSTTQALISMVHSWTKYTDGTGSTVRVVLFDHRKAFYLIDHTLLVRKLLTLDIPCKRYNLLGN